ncbi:MAG: TonB C-terminal domain-containing protein [Longimicrobiales bacterium]
MRRGPSPTALGVSLAIHAILLVPLVVFARPPEPIEFETVSLEVHLMAEEQAELVQPEPQPPQPEPEPEPQPPEPEPEPEPESEAVEEPEPEPEPEREDIEKPPETPEPRAETTEEPPDSAVSGGENLDIATEGREFPFPEYLSNVIIQVNRYFRWSDESRPVGVVYFEITPDGGVRDIRMVEPSGNLRFDFAVQGAVETAGKQGAFGELPEAYAGSFLPVQLEIEPPR